MNVRTEGGARHGRADGAARTALGEHGTASRGAWVATSRASWRSQGQPTQLSRQALCYPGRRHRGLSWRLSAVKCNSTRPGSRPRCGVDVARAWLTGPTRTHQSRAGASVSKCFRGRHRNASPVRLPVEPACSSHRRPRRNCHRYARSTIQVLLTPSIPFLYGCPALDQLHRENAGGHPQLL